MSYMTFSKRSSPASMKKSTSGVHNATALRLSDPGDLFEREADRIADEVMASGSRKRHWSFSGIGVGAPLQRKCGCGGSGSENGECEECKKEEHEQKVQRRSSVTSPGPGLAPPIVHEVLKTAGRPLDKATREFFEPRFAYDLSRVRIHTDPRASDSAKAVSAHAYTVGNHIVFETGLYSADSREGKKLLAHELAHVIQQGPLLYRQTGDKDPLHGPLLHHQHDPTPRFAPTGACYGSAICRDLLTPSKMREKAVEDPANKEKRDHRRQLCQKTPPDPACTADGHGAPAREAAKLLHSYDPNRPAPGVKMLVDKDMESDFGALTITCSKFMPPVSGGPDCITIPDQMEKEAAQFNNTMDLNIGGVDRGKWRERTLEILVHESEHTRFRSAYRASGSFPAIKESAKESTNEPKCSTQDTVDAMNELTAMLTEFQLRMERIRTTAGLSSEDRAKEMNEWRAHRITGKTQSITVSVRTVRCACNCEDADKMIKEAVEFTTASWSQQDKNALHRELRDPRWSDLDLRWPFVAPPVPSVGSPE